MINNNQPQVIIKDIRFHKLVDLGLWLNQSFLTEYMLWKICTTEQVDLSTLCELGFRVLVDIHLP